METMEQKGFCYSWCGELNSDFKSPIKSFEVPTCSTRPLLYKDIWSLLRLLIFFLKLGLNLKHQKSFGFCQFVVDGHAIKFEREIVSAILCILQSIVSKMMHSMMHYCY